MLNATELRTKDHSSASDSYFMVGAVDGFGFFDRSRCAELATEYSASYQAATPFPHIVIDNFLEPALLEMCLADFPADDLANKRFGRAQERLKQQYNPDSLTPRLRQLFYSFNAAPFLKFLEQLTGIKGLIPDPYYLGGGFHSVGNGGHLDIHADFNFHPLMKVERRINVLIYLNKDWSEGYGGSLELWDKAMQHCCVSKTPLFNRCIIFNTSSDSFHGNPVPVEHPLGLPRRSIALYYYTATWDDSKRQHTTQFKPRPGTADQRDWQVWRTEMLRDWLPPALKRRLRRKPRAETKNDAG